MKYFPDSEKISLDQVYKRICNTDLVPSRKQLLDNIDDNFKVLKEHDYLTLADLRKGLKGAKNLDLISKKTGMDIDYLTLLRREIEGYIPNDLALSVFEWL